MYLAYDPLFYREIDLQPFWVSLDDIALHSLRLRAQNLIKVSFSWTVKLYFSEVCVISCDFILQELEVRFQRVCSMCFYQTVVGV